MNVRWRNYAKAMNKQTYGLYGNTKSYYYLIAKINLQHELPFKI